MLLLQAVIARSFYGMASIYHMKAKKQINSVPIGLNGDTKIIDDLNVALKYYKWVRLLL